METPENRRPKNCLECQYGNECRSYYGGSQCHYQREICLEAVRQAREKNKGTTR